jgi:hypothetical protein
MLPFPAAAEDNIGVIPVFIAGTELYGLFTPKPLPRTMPELPVLTLVIVVMLPTPLDPVPRESAELFALRPMNGLGAPIELALLPVEYVEAPVTTGDRLVCVVGMLKLRGVTPKLPVPIAELKVGNVPDDGMPSLNALLPSWLAAVVAETDGAEESANMSSQRGFEVGVEVMGDCERYCRRGGCMAEDELVAEYGRTGDEIGGTGGADDVLLFR